MELTDHARLKKPAIRQIDPNFGTDPSLRPDRKDVADQQHSEHQFRVDRGPSGVAVERRKLLVDPAKVEHSIKPPYHVIGWNHLIEMECVEELPLTRCQPTHHSLPPTLIVSAPPNHASPPSSMEFCNTITASSDINTCPINVAD
jgi:hypothetical protein